jgi:hypothetical protein
MNEVPNLLSEKRGEIPDLSQDFRSQARLRKALVEGNFYAEACCVDCGSLDVDPRVKKCPHCGGRVPIFYHQINGWFGMGVRTIQETVDRVHSDEAYRAEKRKELDSQGHTLASTWRDREPLL